MFSMKIHIRNDMPGEYAVVALVAGTNSWSRISFEAHRPREII